MTDDKPCDRIDLPEDPVVRCPCGFEANEHPAWLRRIARRKTQTTNPPEGAR